MSDAMHSIWRLFVACTRLRMRSTLRQDRNVGRVGFLDSVGSDSLKLAMDTYAGCTVVSAGPIKRRKIGGIDHLTAELEVVTCVV